MKSLSLALGVLAVLAAISCRTPRGDEPTAVLTPDPAVRTSEPALAKAAPCPKLPAGGLAEYDQARALDEAVKRREVDGHDNYGKRLVLYRTAAEAGHLEAQARVGGLMFGTMMTTQAPVASERGEYVYALRFLIIAAVRGSKAARDYVPSMPEIADKLTVPSALDEPLTELPREWIEAAVSEAKAWLDCYGKDAVK